MRQRAALTQAALKYASALANGYSDPTKLLEVYTIPRPKADVRQGLQQAIQKATSKTGSNSLAPQTDEYRALSQAHLRYPQACAGQFQPVPTASRSSPAAAIRAPRDRRGAASGG